MGDKITIDSATMFNKALEIIEGMPCACLELCRRKEGGKSVSIGIGGAFDVEFVDNSANCAAWPADTRRPPPWSPQPSHPIHSFPLQGFFSTHAYPRLPYHSDQYAFNFIRIATEGISRRFGFGQGVFAAF